MTRKEHEFWLSLRLSSILTLLCILIIYLLAAPLLAQTPRMTYKSGQAKMLPALPDDRVVVGNDGSQPADGGKKTCSIQAFPGMPNTVSVASFEIPHKAQNEYEQACAALKSNQLSEAERHLRKATKIDSKYAAGWVMLGQTLQATQQAPAARDACARASVADPSYLPAYLCLAEIAGREQRWHEVLSLTARALELDPANDPYAYFFSAIAYFNLNQLPDAEKTALRAEGIDKNHDEPLLEYLLAQIYEAKHDSVNAALHLRRYQELVPASQASEVVEKDLAQAQNPR